MIRQAAAYATAATIGTVVGTMTGAIFGVAIMALVVERKKLLDEPANVTSLGREDLLEPQDADLGDIHLNT